MENAKNNFNYNYQKNAYKKVVIKRTINAGILKEESVSNSFLEIFILLTQSQLQKVLATIYGKEIILIHKLRDQNLLISRFKKS